MNKIFNFIKGLSKQKITSISLLLLIILHLISITNFLKPDFFIDPTFIDLSNTLQPPALGKNLLGTDEMGRDVFSRITLGMSITLFIGFTSMLMSLLLGVFLGTIAGYYGGYADAVIMRGIDIISSFPRFLLIIAITAITKPTVLTLTIIIGVTGWISIAILIRNKMMSLKQREFITAVEALGGGDARIIFKHLLPNCLPNLIIALTYGIGEAILLECSMSYLNIGIQEPLPSLGNMLYAGKKFLLQGRNIWLAMYSGFTIMIIAISYSFLGDGLSALLNPHFDIRKK